MITVVLLSGGLDSSVVLAHALAKGRDCYALSFNYSQRHQVELQSAQTIAEHYSIPHHTISISPETFQQSSLVSKLTLPKNRNLEDISKGGIPNTYVPARNTLFLAYATSYAELIGAKEIYIGVNAMDKYGYPDCRPKYLAAFQSLLNLATQQAIKGNPPCLVTPLVTWDKTAIIEEGKKLNAPMHLSFSCYDPHEKMHCGQCDACYLRHSGFTNANISDPTQYLNLPIQNI